MMLANRNSSKMEKYPLSLLDNINVCLQSVGDYWSHLVIETNQPVDAQRFRRAVRLSMDAEPIYACKYTFHPWRAYWERLSDDFIDQFELVTLVETTDIDHDLLEFMREPLANGTDPFVRIKIFRAETDHICFKLNVLPADGAGTYLYIRRMLDIYDRLSADPGHTPEPSDMALRSGRIIMDYYSPMDLLRLAFLGAVNHFKNRKTKDNWQFPTHEAAVMKKTYAIRHYGKETVAALNRYRKSVGATVNDVLLAAYYKAMHDIVQPEDPDEFCILNTFDLRKHFPPEKRNRAGNFSSYINTNVYLAKKMPFVDIVRQVQARVKEQKNKYAGLVESPYVWAIFNLLPHAVGKIFFEWLLRKRGDCVPVMTNAGYIDPQQFRIDGVPIKNAYIMSPLTYPPKIVLCFCSCGENMTISTAYSESHCHRQDVDHLFDRFGQIIREEAARVSGT